MEGTILFLFFKGGAFGSFFKRTFCCIVNRYIYKYLNIFVIYKEMISKNITLRVESEIYRKYKEYCKKKGLIVSRQVEIMMEEKLKEEELL